MKNLFWCIFLLLMSLEGFSQIISITDENDIPVQGAIVEFFPSEDILYSNYKGKILLTSNLKYDSLAVYHPEYENANISKPQLESQDYDITLYDCNLVLDEIVFTANKFFEKKSNIPQQIELIRPQNIDLQGSATTADILSNSGKVFVQKSQLGGGSPNIRGFEANKVLLVVDGVRMNNAIFRGGHLQNIVTTNPNAIDNIEVLYGAGSVSYGSDALGGIINVSTSKPNLSEEKNEIEGKVYGSFGSAANEKKIGAIINYGTPKFASLSAFNYAYYGDLRQGANRNKAIGDLGLRPYYAINNGEEDIMVKNNDENVQRFSGYRQYNFIQKLLYQPSDLVKHTINFQYATSSDVPRYDRLSEINTEGNQTNAEWYYGPQDWLMLAYNFQKNTNQKLFDDLELSLAYQQFKESRHTRKFDDAERKNQYEKVDALNFNLIFKKILKKQTLIYGIESYYNDVNSNANYQNIYTSEHSFAKSRYPNGGSEMGALAFYISGHQSFLNKKIFLQEGLRFTYTYLNSKFKDNSDFPISFDDIKQHSSNLSGNLGVVYKPDSKIRMSLNLNTGFRAPNVDDVAKIFDSTPGNLIIPNPNLKPEKTIGTTFSISKVFKDVVKAETVAFFTAFRNIITTQDSNYNGQTQIIYDGVLSQVQQQKNVGKANIYGFNFYLEASISSKLKANANFTYTHGKVLADPDYPMDHIPPIYGQVDLQYKTKKWIWGVYSIYNGKKPIDQYSPFGEDNEKYATPEGMPGWWTLNIKTNYKITSELLLLAGVENIFDRNYRVFASGISAPGRNFIFSLNYTF